MRQQLRQLGLVPVDQLVAIAERQLVVGVDVQPPQQLLFPRRQRLGTDRLDVDEGHQAQHLQPLLEADQGGELLDDLGIFRVAMKGRARHPEVMPDQEVDDLARLRPAAARRSSIWCAMRTLSIACSSSRHLPTSWNSSDRTSSSGLSSSARMPLKRSRAGARGRRQPLEVANRQQRVLVDGVLVVEVADDAPGDRLEFREHLAEQPGIVHLRQAGVQPGPRRQESQQLVARGRGGEEILAARAAARALESPSARSR